MLQHVLVPLDGSEVAEKALMHAQSIIDPAQGRMTLLSVVDIPEYAMVSHYPAVIQYEDKYDKINSELIPQATDYLNKQAESLRASGYTVDVDTITGDAANSIVEKADAIGVDAIVMSTHGRSGITRWLFGSVANKVLESSNCPVFIVPVRKRNP
jgi:nucleotide-binding universal stress UspA family protein